jgi:serine/threonine protein kinase HipA of HipAB toxin-antitoxin module
MTGEGPLKDDQRAQLRGHFTRLMMEQLGEAPEGFRAFRDIADDPASDEATRMIDQLVEIAADEVAANPQRADEADVAARDFVREVLEPNWGHDWRALLTEMSDAAARCRYWPFCKRRNDG